MAYADTTFYKNDFKGVIVPDSDLDHYLQLASDSIDQLTFNRIQVKSIEKLTTFQTRCVKMAVCLQAEHLYLIRDLPDGVTSYNINGTSMSFGGNRDFSGQAVTYLNSTGLTYRGL